MTVVRAPPRLVKKAIAAQKQQLQSKPPAQTQPTITGQPPAAPGTAQSANRGGVNVGSLSCNVAGGVGFVFGSSRTLNCVFTRPDGAGERYEGTIRRYGVDVGFTRESTVVWMVFAPGSIAPGALAGEYAGATAQGTVGVGVGANVLLGGSSNQITLQPVSVEGSVGLNAAAGTFDRTKLNVDGGAIALGHPVGASGNRIVLHLVNAMKRLGLKRGIATECIGGGQGGAMLIETV